jgi:hypothetical protein
MDMIFKYLPVERGLIILFDDAGNPVPKLTKFLEEVEGQDIPISRTILKMVAEQQVSLMTSNALEDARLLGGKSIAIHGIRSAMCVPLWNRNHVIGAVQVDSRIHVGRFTEEDLDLLTALANFAAVAIERAQLSEKIEQERKIRSKMERYHSPAVIDEIVKGVINVTDETEIRQIALEAFVAAGCRGWGRVDVMRDRATGRFYLLEVNTAPGMTSHSLVPKAARQVGVPFEELCWRILEQTVLVAPTEAASA